MGTGILALVLGYLLGAVPSAYIAGRVKRGIDIRRVGGGNMGTLNAMRELGTIPGILVLLADIAKGVLSILIARWIGAELLYLYLAGIAAVLGHIFTVFLKFRGGKGAATAAGVLLGLAPAPAGISCGVFLLVVLLTSNVTLGITSGVVLIPLFLWLFHEPVTHIWFTLVIILILALRYAPTLIRGMHNAEDRRNLFIERRYTPWQTRKKQ